MIIAAGGGRRIGGPEALLHQGKKPLVGQMIDTLAEAAESVAAAVTEAGARATRLLFGETPVRFPLDLSVVDCYADAA